MLLVDLLHAVTEIIVYTQRCQTLRVIVPFGLTIKLCPVNFLYQQFWVIRLLIIISIFYPLLFKELKLVLKSYSWACHFALNMCRCPTLLVMYHHHHLVFILCKLLRQLVRGGQISEFWDRKRHCSYIMNWYMLILIINLYCEFLLVSNLTQVVIKKLFTGEEVFNRHFQASKVIILIFNLWHHDLDEWMRCPEYFIIPYFYSVLLCLFSKDRWWIALLWALEKRTVWVRALGYLQTTIFIVRLCGL